MTLVPSGFAALLGGALLASQVVIQQTGGQPDTTLIYAGTALALGVPIARVLDGVRAKNGDGEE